MDTPYPLPRQTRESGPLVGNGTVGPYGPSTFKIWDPVDVQVWAKAANETTYKNVTAQTVIAKTTPPGDFSTFTITFATPVPATTQWYYLSERLHERQIAVTRGGVIDSVQLEKELSKQGTILQEQWRDLQDAVKWPADYSGNTVMPSPGAGKLIGFAADGSGLVASETTIDERSQRIAGDAAERAAMLYAVAVEREQRIANDQQEAIIRAAADLALASLIGQGGPIEVPMYDSRDAALFATIKSTINCIRTGGRRFAGDGGAAIYNKVAALVLGGFQSADGAFWALSLGQDIRVEHFGAFHNMTWEMVADLGSTNTGSRSGPFRTGGNNDLQAFIDADEYTKNIIKTGEFFAESDRYFLDAQFKLQGRMKSRRGIRPELWLRNSNVYHSNIWIQQSNAGVIGFTMINQYGYSGSKPASNGQMGPGITIASVANSQGGPSIYSDAAQFPSGHAPILDNIEIDVSSIRAGAAAGQISKGAYQMMIAGGVEYSKFRIFPVAKPTNISSNGLCINHWGMQYHNGDPFGDWSQMVIEETYHCTDCTIDIPGHFDMWDNPHGYNELYHSSAGGANVIGDISCRGVVPIHIQPGDAVNNWANPRQKQKVMKGISVGYINGIDIPTVGEPAPAGVTWINSVLCPVRGFGTVQLATDKYDDLDRNRCRQIEVDVKFRGIHLSQSTPNWNKRGVYAQGCFGKLDFGAITTYGIGRAYEIEYCDGDQTLNYVEGDGCLLYEFSRGGRLLQTDTDRLVPGYVENIADGTYRPGTGAGTRAVSITGGSYSTIVTIPAGKANSLTRTYVTPFSGADDDVYEGTPVKIGSQWVSITEFAQGRSTGTVVRANITGISRSNPAIVNFNLATSQMIGLTTGNFVTINGVAGMTQINGQTGQITMLNDGQFSININATGYSTYSAGGTVTPNLVGVNYLVHTPLQTPALAGQTVTVDEFCRVKQGSITSAGGESAVRLTNASVDDLDMHGVKSAGKYGALMTNGRGTLRGPLPMTVGTIAAADNYTISGDAKSLFSMSDGTINDNTKVNYHFRMSKDDVSGAMGHVDLRNCRIENIARLITGTAGTLRYELTMQGCVDTEKNQNLSHPGRQGNDANGYFNYGDDGILRCWKRDIVTGASVDGVAQAVWTFPAPFNAGGDTVVVNATLRTQVGAARSVLVNTGSSTNCTIKVIGGSDGQAFSLNAEAVGRYYDE